MGTVGNKLVSPLASVCLCGVLYGQQVVADRDGRKKNGNKDKDGDELTAAVRAIFDTKPGADHDNRERCPREIEEDFHSYSRPYTNRLDLQCFGFILNRRV